MLVLNWYCGHESFSSIFPTNLGRYIKSHEFQLHLHLGISTSHLTLKATSEAYDVSSIQKAPSRTLMLRSCLTSKLPVAQPLILSYKIRLSS